MISRREAIVGTAAAAIVAAAGLPVIITADEPARVIALWEAGYSWLEACEIVYDEEPVAALIGRMLEAREMRGDFGRT